jgi:hypothetical protein
MEPFWENSLVYILLGYEISDMSLPLPVFLFLVPYFTISLFHYFTISLFYFQNLAVNYLVNR